MLLTAAHLGPGLAVTVVVGMLAAGNGVTAPTTALLVAAVLAGQLTALELNLLASPGLATVEILTGPFAGLTIGEFQLLAEQVLGGNTSVLPAGATLSSVNDQATAINEFFDGGASPDGVKFGCP